MTVSKMDLAPGLRLDADYVGGGTFALLAKKGAGKTYTARVMAEEFWRTGVPFVMLDPMGAGWGLRASADGEGEGIPVTIFGGEHADAPLERGAGEIIADLVVDEGLSMVLDMSALGSRSAEREFARAFLERLYRRNSQLVHLLIDEADLFAPQKPAAGDQALLGVTENIVRRGRNRGIGCTLITQRPAVLNKDVLTQVDGLVAMRITGLTDRKAIDEWVKGHGDDDEAAAVKQSLSSLANGECWWWVPEQGILQKVQVRAAHTFDSSPTRKRGAARRQPKGFADVDMAALEKTMAAAIERAKATDPKELQKRIRELERQLANAPAVEPVEVERIVEKVVEVAPEGLVVHLSDTADQLRALAADIASVRLQVEALPKVDDVEVRLSPAPAPAPAAPAQAPAPRRAAPTGDSKVSRPQQKILNALASLEAIGLSAPKRTHVAFFAEVSPRSSGFEKNISTLSTAGLIYYPQPGCVGLTEDGRAQASTVEAMSTVEEMHDYVRRLVKPAKWNLLDELIDVYPAALSRENLAGRAGVSNRSSGFEKNISGLSSLGLVHYPEPGHVAATPILFLEA